jgi:hypothetical protein
MKVVINSCYGGFGVSAEALKELVLVNAKCIRSMTPEKFYGKGWKEDFDYERKSFIDIGDGFFSHKDAFYVFRGDRFLYDLNNNDEFRSDKDLVAVVEKLGEEANGQFSKLKVVEIPDGISFEINDYDGMESIHQTHQSWS